MSTTAPRHTELTSEFEEALDEDHGGLDNSLLMSAAQGIYGLDGPCGTEDVRDHIDDARRTLWQLQRDGYCVVRFAELSELINPSST